MCENTVESQAVDALAKREAFAVSLRKEKKSQLLRKKREKLQKVIAVTNLNNSRYDGDPTLTPEILERLTQECAPRFAQISEQDPIDVSVCPHTR